MQKELRLRVTALVTGLVEAESKTEPPLNPTIPGLLVNFNERPANSSTLRQSGGLESLGRESLITGLMEAESKTEPPRGAFPTISGLLVNFN